MKLTGEIPDYVLFRVVLFKMQGKNHASGIFYSGNVCG